MWKEGYSGRGYGVPVRHEKNMLKDVKGMLIIKVLCRAPNSTTGVAFVVGFSLKRVEQA